MSDERFSRIANLALFGLKRSEGLELIAEVDRLRADREVVTLDDVYEATTLDALIAEARTRGEWCCEVGCGTGACENCPCCFAGMCVAGFDGVPDDAESRSRWIEEAAECNPIVAALAAVEAERDEARAALDRVTDDSTSGTLHKMLMREHYVTDAVEASFAVTEILATIRAAAAGEQEAP